MSPQDVIDSINEAYNNKVFVVGSKNSYICDEIRTSKDIEKNLVIFFDNKFENDYMTADIMSFLVSEIQQYFPDLHCVGVLGKGVD